jgi:hypothetical protein
MSVESAADRASFLSAAEFGLSATYTPVGGGGAVPVNGIFDNDWLDLDVQGEVNVASRSPRFVCATSALDAAGGSASDATLVVAGVTYKIRVVKPDGTGMTELKLEKQ